jgi:signal transduction histidine kinase
MRRVFVVYGAALTSAVLLALIVPLGLLASTLARDQAMTAARQEAQGLTVIAASANRAHLREVVEALNHGARRTTVFLPDGTTIGAPAAQTPSVRLARRGVAFAGTAPGGQEVLQPVAGRKGVTVIRTFVPASTLQAGVGAAWATLVVVGAFLLAAAVLAGWMLARRLSRSVTDLADAAERVGAGELDATVQPSGPREVAAVGRVLNGLGARIARMLSQERELSADLSHRLRTPVTALRLDVDSLADPQERARMARHVDALAAAVDAAVTAARTPERPPVCARCDATRVVAERARFWAVLAEATHRPFTVCVPEDPLPVRVPADQLGAALDALLDNVFNHTAPGTAFTLKVAQGPAGEVDVVVEDSGPGLARVPAEADIAVDGVRPGAGTGQRRRRSTGLGLEVARRTAETAGGRLDLGDRDAGGARVALTMPLALTER